MSSFLPLNVEIESESEDEIDDSKEIQIEEALKLYQNALKLHSLGPEFYDDAEAAYVELFRSEIFTYPESLSEAQRIEQYGDEVDSEEEFDDVLATTLVAPVVGTDGAPSSLPQILYLAYKNHGQFLLDRLKHDLSLLEHEIRAEDSGNESKNVSETASSSLKLLAEAVDRDDTDLELWRQISRVGGFLGSSRISRFCLEAVLDTEEAEIEPLGLEECFATERLKPLLATLDDQLSQSQLPAPTANQKALMKSMRSHIDPCPYLPVRVLSPIAKTSIKAREQTIKVPSRTWASCGGAILYQLSQEAQGIIDPDPGARYVLSLLRGSFATKDKASGDRRSIRAALPAISAAQAVDSNSIQNESSTTTDDLFNPTKQRLALPSQPDRLSFEQPVESRTTIEGKVITLPNRAGIKNDDHGIRLETSQESKPVSSPTRKRSLDVAELPDSTDVGRARSKRIKARGSIDPDTLKDGTAEDWTRWFEQQLQIYHQADDKVFDSVGNLLARLGAKRVSNLVSLRAIVSKNFTAEKTCEATGTFEPDDVVLKDLQSALDSWDYGSSKAFLNGHDSKDLAGGTGNAQNSSFTAFLETTNKDARKLCQLPILSDDQGLDEFVDSTSEEWISVNALSLQWIEQLIGYSTLCTQGLESDDDITSTYETFLWPEKLKETIVQVLVTQDEFIYSELQVAVTLLEQPAYGEKPESKSSKSKSAEYSKRKYIHLVQVIFELHLDVYGLIITPSSKVDLGTRLQQCDRLGRWFAFSSRLINQWSPLDWETLRGTQTPRMDWWDSLYVRFLWASVVCNGLTEPAARENTIICYRDLVSVLGSFETDSSRKSVLVDLPNNAIMPEISTEIAEREISRLTTMDFFLGIFNSDNNDPLTIIESLEPLLDLSVNHRKPPITTASSPITPLDTGAEAPPMSRENSVPENGLAKGPGTKLLQALHFLEQGSLSLKVFLWQKLRDAYRSIGYPPQVLACDLRILALIVNYLTSATYIESPEESRRDSLLRWLHRIDDHMTRILGTAISKIEAFECIDDHHVCTALESLASLQKILHVFASWEDTIRVGKTPQPVPVGNAAIKGLARATDKFRDMIVKTWTFQFLLEKEAMRQHAELFTSPGDQLIEKLEQMHQALGLRCYCPHANKSFLRLMKTELERCKDAENWETDMAQLVFDLYGVKISANATEMQDHFCPPEELDRITALEILDLVMIQVKRKEVKDLLKSDIKNTIEKMQQVIRVPKLQGSRSRTFNSRLINNYLKSPINPFDLYRALRGIGGLSSLDVCDEGFDVAAKGWYFLLGQLSLTKFTSQKRTFAGSTEDLEIARTFFRHDLEFNTDRWETWYRLGKVFDATIDEEATWSADKLDNHMDDLAVSQRKAIHCYSMALAVATRCARNNFEETEKIAELCADYGARLYASSREPFSMRAFSLDDYKRHFNSRTGGMYEGRPFHNLLLYPAWKLASTLLRKAAVWKPRNWVVLFKLGKVLWKMHNCSDDVRGKAPCISYQPALDAFLRAIEACPEKRDARHPEKDPILEPHYKLVSIVHKLVVSRRISIEEGCQILKATPYSLKTPEINEDEDWEAYMLQVLKALRSADKANWHHRMVARAAYTIYDNDRSDPRAILGAKYEFNQQIFTKTMTIQVWKPDNERPGRHFVYTSRYVRFFTRLLYQLNDKTSLEALARRIRKKSGDFVDHSGVWEEVCRAYLMLLRHQPDCNITDGFSEMLFQGMHPDVYAARATRLEAWMHMQSTNPPIVDILREAIELKKLNNNLFKSTLFEDLIRDIYAHLYESIVPGLIAQDAVEENRVRMSVDNILTNQAPTVETPPVDFSAAQAEQQKSRARWLTQRELVRRAEAIAAKPAPTVPAKVLKALAPSPMSSKEQSKQLGQSGSTPALAVVIDLEKDNASSVPGSVHDSADDESELSEVDEEVADSKLMEASAERPALFPGLLAAKTEDVGDEDGNMGGITEDETHEGDDWHQQEEEPEVPETQPKESGVPESSW